MLRDGSQLRPGPQFPGAPGATGTQPRWASQLIPRLQLAGLTGSQPRTGCQLVPGPQLPGPEPGIGVTTDTQPRSDHRCPGAQKPWIRESTQELARGS
jgi:hypothetical protein